MASAAAQSGATGAPATSVVIVGAGIIGASTAYYLSELGHTCTVVEREDVACAASGKAGGFLALDWNDSSAVGPLARLSYRLHADLAAKFGSDVLGYRTVNTLQVVGSEAPRAGKPRPIGLPTWVDGNVASCSDMGDTSSTAQVHPAKLTRAMLDAALAAGSRLVKGTATGLVAGSGSCITGVVVDGKVLPCEALVIAMGPWSDAARKWLEPAGLAPGGLPLVGGQKYHSVVVRPSQLVDNTMLFTSFRLASGRNVEPEVYPRPDGSVYACGEPQSLAVPPSPADVDVRPELCESVMHVASSLASVLKDAQVEARQACYLPLTPDGLPAIGRVPLGPPQQGPANSSASQGAVHPGLYVATGHSCWGILNGPATGKALAELLVSGQVQCVDLSAFNPARFAALQRAQ